MGAASPGLFPMPAFISDFGRAVQEMGPANRQSMGDRKHSMLLALLQGSARSGTTGEAAQEGGHIQLTPGQPSTFATPGDFFFPRIPQNPPWPARVPPLPRICCSLIPKPGHQKSQSTGAVKSQVPAGTVPCDRGVPALLGHCRKDLGILLLPPGMDLPGDDLGWERQCSVLLDHCSQVGSKLCYCSSVNQHPPRAVRGLRLAGASSRILCQSPSSSTALQQGFREISEG